MIRLVVPVITVAVLMPMPAQAFLSRLSRARQQVVPLAQQASRTVITKPVAIRQIATIPSPVKEAIVLTPEEAIEARAIRPHALPWHRRPLAGWAGGTALGAGTAGYFAYKYGQETEKHLAEEYLKKMTTLVKRLNPNISEDTISALDTYIKALTQLEHQLAPLMKDFIERATALNKAFNISNPYLQRFSQLTDNLQALENTDVARADATKIHKALDEIRSKLQKVATPDHAYATLPEQRTLDANAKLRELANIFHTLGQLKEIAYLKKHPPIILRPGGWFSSTITDRPENIIQELHRELENILKQYARKPLSPAETNALLQAIALKREIDPQLRKALNGP